MKLFYSKWACSLAIRILIHELGIKSEYESVSLGDKKTESGLDYYTINPKGSVPALMLDDHTVLTENNVIQQYLADTFHATALLPPVGDFQRYRVLEWSNLISNDLHKAFGMLFNMNIPEELKKTLFIPYLNKRFSLIDDHLKDNAYLMGDQFTIADSYLFVVFSWAKRLKLEMPDFTHLERYFNALKNRRSIADSLAEEGIKV